MLWNKLMQLFFGGSLIVAQTLPPDPLYIRASMDELLSYECGKSVAGMLPAREQTGPVFSDHGLVFTSIEAADTSRLLVLSAGAGTYSVRLEKAGVNRIRFAIPVKGAGGTQTYFLSYLHDPVSNSRVFDFSSGRPPLGKDETDYALLNVRRADHLLPNLDYSIHETAESLLAALTEGRLRRDQVLRQKAENCEHITRKTPVLGRNLKRNLDVVEMIVMGPKLAGPKLAGPKLAGRKPASAKP